MVLTADPGSSEQRLSCSRLQAPLIPAQLASQRRGCSCKCTPPPALLPGAQVGLGPLPREASLVH